MARTFTGQEARLLLRRGRTAALATLAKDGGTPYASIINLATDLGGAPVIFVSRLAWHTRNILGDPRGSILASELPGEGDALTGKRVTVMGRFAPMEAADIRERYAACHPAARLYLEFADFGFWRLEPEVIHAVAGFGRIETLKPDEVFLDGLDAALYESAAAHVNAEHPEAASLYATRLLGAGALEWRIAEADPDGCQLSAGEHTLRLDFDEPALDAGALRRAFVRLSQKARAA